MKRNNNRFLVSNQKPTLKFALDRIFTNTVTWRLNYTYWHTAASLQEAISNKHIEGLPPWTSHPSSYDYCYIPICAQRMGKFGENEDMSE